MLSIAVSNVVAQIVRHHLLPAGNEKAMYFSFDCGLGYYVDSRTVSNRFNQRRGLHLLYHLKPGYGSISVFSAVTESPFAKLKDISAWKHEVTHDSCWRDVRIFTEVYFEMAEKINQALLEKQISPAVAPAAMSEYTSFRSLNNLFELVPVSISVDNTDNRNYKRVIHLLEQE